MIFMHYIDIYYMAMPTLHHHFHPSWVDLACFVGIGGALLAAIMRPSEKIHRGASRSATHRLHELRQQRRADQARFSAAGAVHSNRDYGRPPSGPRFLFGRSSWHRRLQVAQTGTAPTAEISGPRSDDIQVHEKLALIGLGYGLL